MKKIMLFSLILSFGVSLNAQVTLSSQADSASYAFGQLIGRNLARQMPPGLNIDIVMEAMKQTVKGGTLQLTDEAANTCYTSFAQKAEESANAEKAKEGEANKAIGQAFLEKNKKNTGVTVTPSGLQYEVLQRGTGTVSPKATDKVKVHYHGTNIDGSVFDSSVERGEPITFGLNQVIKGWTEGVQLMHVGDKFRFYIPSELAYGAGSPSPKIKPNSVLIFEVELLGINE